MNKVIDCLKRITIAIRAPASVDRYKKAQNVDIDFYRPTDRNHIMELFPAVGPILGDRLLEAVLSRRRFLRYTEDHRMKLGHKSSFQIISGIFNKPCGKNDRAEVFDEKRDPFL